MESVCPIGGYLARHLDAILLGFEHVCRAVVKEMKSMMARAAKVEERSWLVEVVEKTGKIPEGNRKSYKP
jgi:hypothetical protein